MVAIRVLDTETTGLKGELIEVGAIDLDDDLNIIKVQEDLVRPVEHKISFGAMNVHHITPEMVADKPTLPEVIDKYKMEEGYFIAHNASFDLGMLPSGTIGDDVRVLCTLKLAKKFIDKTRFGDHKLGTLYYGFGCYKGGDEYSGDAHRAGFDCYMTVKVLRKILEENKLTLEEAYDMIQPNAPDKPIEDTLCFMKKYRDSGKTWKQVKKEDPSYCGWLVGNYNWSGDNLKVKKYLEGK